MKLKAKDALLFSIPAVAVGSHALLAPRMQARPVDANEISCGESCVSTIEPQASNQAGELPALRRLSEQLQKCPRAKVFITNYSVPVGLRNSGKPTQLYYSAKDRMLWIRPSYSGDHRLWHRVTPAMITTVIDRFGDLRTLKSLGADQTVYASWEAPLRKAAK